MTEVALAIPDRRGPHRARNPTELPYPKLAPKVWGRFKQTSRPRNWCLKAVHSPWLNQASIMVILVNCMVLGMDKPGLMRSYKLEILDFFVVVFFIMEMLIKMMATGVFGYEGSYLRNRWNKFDVFINFGELVYYLVEYFGLNVRVCQVLGPMRLVSRVKTMREVVTVLLDILPMLGSVLILELFVIHIFGVMGVQLWAGELRNRCFLGEDVPTKYNVSLSPYYMTRYDELYPFLCSPEGENGVHRCHDLPPYREKGQTCSLTPPHGAKGALAPTVAGASPDDCVNWNELYSDCRATDHNPYGGAINFDNIGYAYITIFQVVTLNGWAAIMCKVMDVYSFWSFLYFLLVTIMGSFIMMNVCAVVIATQFSDKLELMTKRQSDGTSVRAVFFAWICSKSTGCLQGIKRASSRVFPHGDHRGTSDLPVIAQLWRAFKERIEIFVDSKVFSLVTTFAVLLSILTMAIEYHDQPNELTDILRISNNILTIVFVVEMVLKLIALSWLYFKDGHNLFDFAIVIISLWETITEADRRLSVLRAFRLLRFVRLLHYLPNLRKQLLVLKRAVEGAALLCMITLFVIFIFSIIGIHLFGNRFPATNLQGDADRKHFDTVLHSMVTVFQIMTEENWHLVLYNTMAATSPWASVYFAGVIVIGNLICLNILVGIVIQGFKHKCTESDDVSDTSLAINSSSEEAAAPPNTSEDSRSLNRVQKALRWCKEHEEWSFYVMSPQNRLRIFCQRVIGHKMFDYTVLLFILLNCITIATERPGIKPDSKEHQFLDTSSYVFSAIFLVEMLFKVLALGLLFGSESYCRSSWNAIDGSLVVISLVHITVSLTTSGQSTMLGIVKVLRLLRTFRPLRLIKRAPKLKLAVEALIAAVKPMGNIFLISCIFIFFYSILGVQLFKGKFFTCLGDNLEHITNKTDCLVANYRWERSHLNFDSLPQALMTVFVMYSKDGWVAIMYNGLDAVGVDQQPVMNYNEWMLLFFITFVIMSFFLLDMFIGAMVETFHQCQQAQRIRDAARGKIPQGRGAGVREHEEIPYYEYYSDIRRAIHTLCISHFQDVFMAVVISLSVLVMAIEHYDQPLYIETIIEYSHYVLTVILIIEVVLKIVAFGGKRFLNNSWNLLDVGVVLVSVMSIVLNEMSMAETIPINPSILRVCRVFRLAKVLRANKIRVLLKTIHKTLLQVGNICLLFTFFFYIYAALGVELFGDLKCVEDDLCRGLNDYINFRHFGMALLALFQVCTGDNWSIIMRDTMKPCRPENEDCSTYLTWVAPLYFIAFVITAQFVLVNLVVAVIMQAMEDSDKKKQEVPDARPLRDSS